MLGGESRVEGKKIGITERARPWIRSGILERIGVFTLVKFEKQGGGHKKTAVKKREKAQRSWGGPIGDQVHFDAKYSSRGDQGEGIKPSGLQGHEKELRSRRVRGKPLDRGLGKGLTHMGRGDGGKYLSVGGVKEGGAKTTQ